MSRSLPTVVAVNISPGGIPKRPTEVAQVTSDGIVGDGHNHDKHNTPMQAISLIDAQALDDLRDQGFDVYPGATGENLTVRGLNVDALHIGDRLHFNEGVELQITKVRKPCYVLDAISPRLQRAIAGRCGCYARVITTGEIRAGETIQVHHAIPDQV
ncbi:MAG: MOSC domain-containing protein [Phycisphaerales bacterium]|nr:MOSC domain-containing protein [Planctomycetota bacterium]MCZ6612600.1 MOSC domain-containing protein [Planctomycetota bacterium]